MPDELLRKSSMFRRDMRKLNMMKEVKALLENKQRIDLLSPAKHKDGEQLQEKPPRYLFQYQRRSSLGEDKMKLNLAHMRQRLNSPTPGDNKQNFNFMNSPRITGNQEQKQKQRSQSKALKANDHKILQDQFIKILEQSSINDFSSNSLLCKETAAALQSEEVIEAILESKHISNSISNDLFDATFEENTSENDNINNVDSWSINSPRNNKNSQDQEEEFKSEESDVNLSQYLDQIKKDQEQEMLQTLNEIVKLLRTKKQPPQQQSKQISIQKPEVKMNEGVLDEMEQFFNQMEDGVEPQHSHRQVLSSSKQYK